MRLILIFLLISINTFSHPGRVAGDGCHVCKKNCAKYKLKTGQRHGHGANARCEENQKEKSKSDSYNREKFSHWDDDDRDCQNTRAEVLIKRSKSDVLFRNKKNCVVDSGLWDDYYYAETLTKASQVDIDHLVPLKNAWESGASNWDSKRRAKFANDFENLVITNRSYNRQKGAKTPLEWAPVRRDYYCKYLKDWVKIKKKYELKINPKIFEFIKQASCE